MAGKYRFGSLIIAMLLIIVILPVLAQETRDYAIVNSRYEIITAEDTLRLTVTVENKGADANAATDLVVLLLGDSTQELTTAPIPSLTQDQLTQVEIDVPLANLPAGATQTLELRAGVDNYERANTTIAEDNVVTLTVDLPVRPQNVIESPDTLFQLTDDGVIVLGTAYSRNTAIMALAAFLGIILLLWIMTIIFRSLFSRPPRFGAWQPPYGTVPMLDQNSIDGRRWAWQQHAQNSLLLAAPTQGNIHPIKLLLGANGNNLDHWKATAMRLSQYDSYGRIARTQTLADKKWVNRLNQVIKKRHKLNETQLQKRLRPIAQALVKQFSKKLAKKTAFLPIAYDIRWQGKHGDVRIFFELYQCREHAWYQIDRWEPIMQVVSSTMQENYGYTIHGKDPNESLRDFRARLRDDLIWLLLESLRLEMPQADSSDEQPVARPQYTVPDTLSGMSPITEDAPAKPHTATPTTP